MLVHAITCNKHDTYEKATSYSKRWKTEGDCGIVEAISESYQTIKTLKPLNICLILFRARAEYQMTGK